MARTSRTRPVSDRSVLDKAKGHILLATALITLACGSEPQATTPRNTVVASVGSLEREPKESEPLTAVTTPSSTLRRPYYGTKITECKRVVAAINTAVERIAHTPSKSNVTMELYTVAMVMDSLAAAIEGFRLSTPVLGRLANDYVRMARDIAVASRHLADAIDHVDMKRMLGAQTRLSTASGREDRLTRAINAFCRAP